MKDEQFNTLGAAFDAAISQNQQTGAGAGKPNLAADVWGEGKPINTESLAAAWYAGERLGSMAALLAIGAGAAVEHIGADGKAVKVWRDDSALGRQAADDLAMCRKFARLLRQRVAGDGREVNQASEDDATGAGVADVVAYRNGALPAPTIDGERVAEAVAVVAWRAVVASMAADKLGEAVELSSVGEDWLSREVDACAFLAVAGIETRGDKARRWLAERAKARAKARVAARLDLFKAGASKRRRDLIDRIARACELLIAGAAIDDAAVQVGFKASGKRTSAGDRLTRAVRALGLPFRLNARQYGEAGDKSKTHAGAAVDLARLYAPPFKITTIATTTSQPAQAGAWCGASCLAAAAVRSVAKRGATRARLIGRQVRGGLRFDWAQLSPAARLAALPSGQRAALLAVASGQCAKVERRGLLARDTVASVASVASAGEDVSKRPAQRATLRRALRAVSRRKLRGVLRSVK